MQEFPDDIVITVDDDLFYRSDLVESLLRHHREHPGHIIANWAKRINPDTDKYCWWPDVTGRPEASRRFVLLGVSGVLYPPHSLHPDAFNPQDIIKLSLTADDVWLSAMALRQGTPIFYTAYSYNHLPVSIRNNETLISGNYVRNQQCVDAINAHYARRGERRPFIDLPDNVYDSASIMNILFTVNNAYVPWLSVLLTSLFANNPGQQFHIYVLGLDISASSRQTLHRQVEEAGSSLHFPAIDESLLGDLHKIAAGFPSSHNITFLLRLLFEKVMPQDVKSFLYLDTDMIVSSPIDDLINYRFDSDKGAAVVRDVFRQSDYARLGFDSGKEWYFNAGMMYVNLDYWREHNVGRQCIDYLLKHPGIPMPDQDALNRVLRGHVDYIHPRFNCLTLFSARDEELRKRILPCHIDEVRDAARNPAIIHYVFVNKPWFRGMDMPHKQVWRRFHRLSPYADAKLRWRGGVRGMMKMCVSATLGLMGVKRFKSIF